MELQINTSKTYRDIDKSRKICILQGGTRSGKSHSALQWLIVKALSENGTAISVVRKSFPSMRVSILRDFQQIMKGLGIWNEDNWSTTAHIYIFDNDSYIEFLSVDNAEKRKGTSRDYLFIDECNELSREDYFQLFIRTRKKTIIAYNPSFGTNNYIFNEIHTHPESDLYISTFRDNPYLEQSIIDEILRLKETNAEYYKIYGEGQPGNNIGTIFSINVIDEIPEGATFLAFGMDYGFTVDPSTLVTVSRKDNNLYLDELLYRTGMVTGDIINYLKSLDIGRNEIWADSAEGRLIEEIYRAGFNIKPVKKGPDSVRMGIDLMMNYKLWVTKRSHNMIREFSEYVWMIDKNGNFENKPVDYSNHCIDAVRYVVMETLTHKRINAGKYNISVRGMGRY